MPLNLDSRIKNLKILFDGFKRLRVLLILKLLNLKLYQKSINMKSKDILNLFYLKFKSKSKFKFSNITSKYLFKNHFNTIFMENIKKM